MNTKNTSLSINTNTHTAFVPDIALNHTRITRYIGSVTAPTNERVLATVGRYTSVAPHESITLLVTSTGGPTGLAMSFYDTVRYLIRPNLVTVGSGDVDSSGVIIFLSGGRVGRSSG